MPCSSGGFRRWESSVGGLGTGEAGEAKEMRQRCEKEQWSQAATLILLMMEKPVININCMCNRQFWSDALRRDAKPQVILPHLHSLDPLYCSRNSHSLCVYRIAFTPMRHIAATTLDGSHHSTFAMFTTPSSRLSEKLVASTQRGHQLQFTVIISLPLFPTHSMAQNVHQTLFPRRL